MSGFYQILAQYYDRIFKHDYSTQAEFIHGFLPDQPSSFLLELGCGTGHLAAELARRGYPVLATDLSEEMISAARSRETEYPLLSYDVKDMTTIASDFTGVEFQGVFCFGNTLVHLSDFASGRKLIEDFYRLTAPGGYCLIQILNYDSVSSDFEFSDITEGDLRFERSYRPGDNSSQLKFHTSLTLGDQVFCGEADHLIIKQQDLSKLLSDSGFSSIQWYSNFNGDHYRPDGMVTIAVARK